MGRWQARYHHQMKCAQAAREHAAKAKEVELERVMLGMLKELYEEVNSGNAEDDTNTRWPEVRDLIKAMEGEVK